MNPGSVVFRPAFLEVIEARVELEKERINLQMVLGPQTFERVRAIVEAQDTRKRAAFYGTICEAARNGEDFSHVESIQDIGDIYARFIIGRAFGE